MSDTEIFSFNALKQLDEVIKSSTVANLKTANDIHDVIYPYVRAVIDDVDAYEESKTSYIYKCISLHIESGESVYNRMDLETSMCFTLYMYIYH